MRLNLLMALAVTLTLTACNKPEAQKMMDDMTDHGGAMMDKMEETGEKMMDKAEDTMDAAENKVMEIKEEAEEAVTALSATYTDYEANKGTGKKHILFFHASWCGTCVAWEKKINEMMAELPENTLILKADYDSNTDLRTQYEINKQSTAAFINADGSVAKTEMDPSLDSVKAFFAE